MGILTRLQRLEFATAAHRGRLADYDERIRRIERHVADLEAMADLGRLEDQLAELKDGGFKWDDMRPDKPNGTEHDDGAA